MALPGDMWAAVTGVILIIELTRRLAGMALVIIAGVFVAYAFLGPWLPGIFEHRATTPNASFPISTPTMGSSARRLRFHRPTSSCS